MKIHIMADMEGCAGIANERDCLRPGSKHYEEACDLVSLEVSAAVEGALEAGATEVLVIDGHGPGAIKRSLLHPRAKLLAGRSSNAGLSAFGCDGSFAASMIIGQSAMSNTGGGCPCRAPAFTVEKYVLNGRAIGQLGLWMLMAGYHNVPVVMVSGDQAACDEATALVPNIETAPVKWDPKRDAESGLTKDANAVFNAAAVHLRPGKARALIRERACRAVKRIPEIPPFHMEPPYKVTISYRPAEGQKRLQMIWPSSLANAPASVEKPAPSKAALDWPVPEGYELRTYRESDEAEHAALMRSAGFTTWTEENTRESLPACLPAGFFVIVHVPSRKLVATSMARHWPTADHPSGGVLDWVAVDSDHRGKELGCVVCAAATRRLLEAGYSDIYLQTDDFRLAAIKTYLKLGYVPLFFAPDMIPRWQEVFRQLLHAKAYPERGR